MSALAPSSEQLLPFSRGFRIADIASRDLVTVPADVACAAVRDDARYAPFDWLPVVTSDGVVGVLERGAIDGARIVGNAMRPLASAMLVSGDAPLANYVLTAQPGAHQLVLTGGEITGIVTRSDLHKMPVRVLLFALVSEIEREMARLITQLRPVSWIDLLGEKARMRLDGLLYEARGEDPDPIELTSFGDKATLVAKLYVFPERSMTQTRKELSRVQVLRNNVAHAKALTRDAASLDRLIADSKLAAEWLGRLQAAQG